MIPATLTAVRATLKGIRMPITGKMAADDRDIILADLDHQVMAHVFGASLQSKLLKVRTPNTHFPLLGYAYRPRDARTSHYDLILAEDIHPLLPLHVEARDEEPWPTESPLVISLHQYFKNYLRQGKYFHLKSLLMSREFQVDDIEIKRIQSSLSDPKRYRIIDLVNHSDDSGQSSYVIARAFEAGYAIAILGLGFDYVAGNLKEKKLSPSRSLTDLISISDLDKGGGK